jgi:hypothetical protein
MPVPACESWCAREGASSEAEPARGGVRPRARRNLLEGVLALEQGGTHSRGRLIGPLWWAARATTAWVMSHVRV